MHSFAISLSLSPPVLPPSHHAHTHHELSDSKSNKHTIQQGMLLQASSVCLSRPLSFTLVRPLSTMQSSVRNPLPKLTLTTPAFQFEALLAKIQQSSSTPGPSPARGAAGTPPPSTSHRPSPAPSANGGGAHGNGSSSGATSEASSGPRHRTGAANGGSAGPRLPTREVDKVCASLLLYVVLRPLSTPSQVEGVFVKNDPWLGRCAYD